VNPSALLLIILAFGFLYFVLVRPQKRRQSEQQRMLSSLQEGDEIVTAGGIYGEISGFQEDDVLVKIAPELEVRVARRAIGGVTHRADEPEEADEPDEPEEAEEPETAEEPEDSHDSHDSEHTET
jgi:preprotein translocase subunit YajC